MSYIYRKNHILDFFFKLKKKKKKEKRKSCLCDNRYGSILTKVVNLVLKNAYYFLSNIFLFFRFKFFYTISLIF
jgi:hypothetical protein